ncbi:hypothetical protein FRX31_004159 [Thalictrum thalictroides]|uniref:Uncharacterized protein n=1 Tax=Thalictrum thalictroides TaxID=46969 RepID=A0A7J6X9W9_THATH|nr:hypothetical protein FRX31_004159 [Thalictrum thalictroides]
MLTVEDVVIRLTGSKRRRAKSALVVMANKDAAVSAMVSDLLNPLLVLPLNKATPAVFSSPFPPRDVPVASNLVGVSYEAKEASILDKLLKNLGNVDFYDAECLAIISALEIAVERVWREANFIADRVSKEALQMDAQNLYIYDGKPAWLKKWEGMTLGLSQKVAKVMKKTNYDSQRLIIIELSRLIMILNLSKDLKTLKKQQCTQN